MEKIDFEKKAEKILMGVMSGKITDIKASVDDDEMEIVANGDSEGSMLINIQRESVEVDYIDNSGDIHNVPQCEMTLKNELLNLVDKIKAHGKERNFALHGSPCPYFAPYVQADAGGHSGAFKSLPIHPTQPKDETVDEIKRQTELLKQDREDEFPTLLVCMLVVFVGPFLLQYISPFLKKCFEIIFYLAKKGYDILSTPFKYVYEKIQDFFSTGEDEE